MIVYHAIESVRVALLCLQPIIPSTVEAMLKHLGIVVSFDGSTSIAPLCKFGYKAAENQVVSLAANIPFVKFEYKDPSEEIAKALALAEAQAREEKKAKSKAQKIAKAEAKAQKLEAEGIKTKPKENTSNEAI